MPRFLIHFRSPDRVSLDQVGLEFPDLHAAYLDVYAAIPDKARSLLLEGQDPMLCSYLICDASGASLMIVPFTEILAKTPPEEPVP